MDFKIIVHLRKSLFVLALMSFHNFFAQNYEDRISTIDVLNYKFSLTLTDTNNKIEGIAEITIKFKKPTTSFSLDLVKNEMDSTGMIVSSILENTKQISYSQHNNLLELNIGLPQENDVRTYTITYHGIPLDGLIISKNKYGDRTFFGDNWPDRAKNWLPVVDHPSDKATVDWNITAPSYYQVIGNGLLMEITNLNDNQTFTRWKMDEPIPTKVMVIGVARFATEYLKKINTISVSSWVYPQDKVLGFKDFAATVPILKFMMTHIGDYPFKKLANVQSKTRFGGMENAGNIFYNEKSISGNNEFEDVIAHEIAHQWFGDSASELSWYHVWLSEGFSTYLENFYFEDHYGRESFVQKMKKDREKALNFEKRSLTPIVDTTVTDYFKLLNPNTYEKGSWVLHMLRRQLRDDLFWKGIKTYYEEYKYGNALSEDFERVIETISGKDYSSFFNQWLYKTGHPQLKVQWESKNNELNIKVKQTQDNLFTFPLDIKITYNDGASDIKTIDITERLAQKTVTPLKKVSSIELDPDTWLFFEQLSLKQK